MSFVADGNLFISVTKILCPSTELAVFHVNPVNAMKMIRVPLIVFAVMLLFPAVLQAQPKKIAVLVGVDMYVNLTDLQYPKNDVEKLRDTLLRTGFDSDDVFCLVRSDRPNDIPTRRNIRRAVMSACKRAQKDDTLLVVLCGHGIEMENGKQMFCPQDADETEHDTTMVSIEEIYDHMEKSEATNKLLIVDACRTREAPLKAGARSTVDVNVLSGMPEPPKGCALLQSCSQHERSLEDSEAEHGIFSRYIIEGLSGKAANHEGRITLSQLSRYARDRTMVRANEINRSIQTPVLSGDFQDFTLALDIFKPLRLEVTRDVLEMSEAVAKGEEKEFFTENVEQKFKRWNTAAGNKIPEGLFMLGNCHYWGIGVPKSDIEALTCYRQAAKSAYPPAMLTKGFFYHVNPRVAKEIEDPMSILRSYKARVFYFQRFFGLAPTYTHEMCHIDTRIDTRFWNLDKFIDQLLEQPDAKKLALYEALPSIGRKSDLVLCLHQKDFEDMLNAFCSEMVFSEAPVAADMEVPSDGSIQFGYSPFSITFSDDQIDISLSISKFYYPIADSTQYRPLPGFDIEFSHKIVQDRDAIRLEMDKPKISSRSGRLSSAEHIVSTINRRRLAGYRKTYDAEIFNLASPDPKRTFRCERLTAKDGWLIIGWKHE